MRLAAAAVAVVLAGTAGCGGAKADAEGCTDVDRPELRTPAERDAPTRRLDPRQTHTVRFETNCGAFTVTLEPRTSPRATASVYTLAKDGFYDDVAFHRIVRGFVIQGGDPTGTGGGGPGYTTIDPPPPSTEYVRGTVAMAKTATEPRGAAGSQFFVVTAPTVGLARDYAVIGHVSDGLEVVLRIGSFGDRTEVPTKRVVIEHAVAKSS